MSYSIDLRKRVVDYVENGGRIAQAAVLFKVGRATIYRWLGRSDLQPTKIKRRKRKLDWQALEKDVKENPDARLIDRAKKFGTRPSAICYALKEMKITRKKKNFVTRKETEKKELNTTLISEK
jgi:transposase